MNMMVSATAIAAASPAQALVASPDQDLIDLAQQMMDRLPEHRAALKRSADLWAEFDPRKPPRSDVLKWRPGEEVGYETERLPDGRRVLWCNPYNIAKLRGVPQYDWYLLEQREAEFWALPKDDQLTHLGAPKPHVQHLFSRVASKRKQTRLDDDDCRARRVY